MCIHKCRRCEWTWVRTSLTGNFLPLSGQTRKPSTRTTCVPTSKQQWPKGVCDRSCSPQGNTFTSSRAWWTCLRNASLLAIAGSSFAGKAILKVAAAPEIKQVCLKQQCGVYVRAKNYGTNKRRPIYFGEEVLNKFSVELFFFHCCLRTGTPARALLQQIV